ncbi:hypothetical protein C0995_001079 [Termitomyces sp. Mi166|nr:hypothetical protein C0995_001079 [Termitomyces sp. Mi166\
MVTLNPDHSYIPDPSPPTLDPLEPLTPTSRRTFIASVLNACTPSELQYISTTISPLLNQRDLLSPLPPEIGLCILGFVESPLGLLRVGAVSRKWGAMAGSEELWRGMVDDEPLEEMEGFAELPMDAALEWLVARKRKPRRCKSPPKQMSYRAYFKNSYMKLVRWQKGGRILRTHRLPMLSSPPLPPSHPSPQPNTNPRTHSPPQPDSGVVTCIALDPSWIVVGLASSRIHIFSARTGVLARTLVGHESGVWGLCLVSAFGRGREGTRTRKKARGGKKDDGLWKSLPSVLRTAVGLGSENDLDDDDDDETVKLDSDSNSNSDTDTDSYSDSVDGETDDQPTNPRSTWKERYVPERQSSPCFASEGWGQPNALVVSGGCDKVVRVWDVKSGHCIYTLPGHTSTIRCMRTLHHRPIAITGSRDGTLRTWDIQRGRALRVLEGHSSSVRCLDVNGARAVSGSYDTTCRIWDLDTGECLRVLRGHYHQVYSVAFDGMLIATGGLDTTIRVWDAETGICQALLQGHTSLVCQLQLSRRHRLLVTGGSDGSVITFSLANGLCCSGSAEHAEVLMPPLSVGVGEEKKKNTNDDDGVCVSSSSSSHSLSVSSSPSLNALSPSLSHNSLPTPAPTHAPQLQPQPQPKPKPKPKPKSRPFNPTPTPTPTTNPGPYAPLYRLPAHTSSVTSLQFDGRFLVTGGNDGCVHVWETWTGKFVRRLDGDGEGPIWRVGFVGGARGGGGRGEEGEGERGEEAGDVCVVAGRREGKTVLDVWGFGELGEV